MTKPRTILIVSGTLVIIGIGISFYQSQMEMDSLTSQQRSLASGTAMIISKNLDFTKSKNGVYSVQITDFRDGDNVKVGIADPTGTVVTTTSIMKSAFQENFTISQAGNYTLEIENTGPRDIQMLGIIGYYPQGATILDVFGVILLISGLSGLAVGMMYLIKRRGKMDVN